jgi:hypothetical protein
MVLIMNLPLLIIGGNKNSRRKEALRRASQDSSMLDTIVLDTSEARGIDDVRNLRPNLSRRPFESAHQTFMVHEAQNLTIEAQNALLKNLEEPNPSTKIILTAPTAESVLSTLSSRCIKSNLARSENENPTSTILDTYLKTNPYDSYQKADKFDIDAWIDAWRKLLLDSFVLGGKNRSLGRERKRLLNYIKLVLKLNATMKRRASSKLVKLIILLEAPQISG